MKGGDPASVELSAAQVDRTLRSVFGSGVLPVLMAGLAAVRETLAASPEIRDDKRLRRSLICGLSLLASFPVDGTFVSVADAARSSGMNRSTVQLYATTLRAVGLLERDPETRRYRLAYSGDLRSAEPQDAKRGPRGRFAVDVTQGAVQRLLQEAADAGELSLLLSGRLDVRKALEAMPPRGLSTSLVVGLGMLAVFPLDGGYRGNAEIARELDMRLSTAHSYISTLVAVGLLERDSATRLWGA